jgi:hypothetical protein
MEERGGVSTSATGVAQDAQAPWFAQENLLSTPQPVSPPGDPPSRVDTDLDDCNHEQVICKRCADTLEYYVPMSILKEKIKELERDIKTMWSHLL